MERKSPNLIAAWIGAAGAVIAAIIGGVFLLISDTGREALQQREQPRVPLLEAAVSVGHDILMWSALRVQVPEDKVDERPGLLILEARIRRDLELLGVQYGFPPSPYPNHKDIKKIFIQYDGQITAELKSRDEELDSLYQLGLTYGLVKISLIGEYGTNFANQEDYAALSKNIKKILWLSRINNFSIRLKNLVDDIYQHIKNNPNSVDFLTTSSTIDSLYEMTLHELTLR